MLTQVEMIKTHLKRYGSITSWEAIKRYKITRLSSVIYILIHRDGWEFKKERIYTRKWFYLFRKKKFVKYILKKGK